VVLAHGAIVGDRLLGQIVEGVGLVVVPVGTRGGGRQEGTERGWREVRLLLLREVAVRLTLEQQPFDRPELDDGVPEGAQVLELVLELLQVHQRVRAGQNARTRDLRVEVPSGCRRGRSGS
jgi:hypothetical protein